MKQIPPILLVQLVLWYSNSAAGDYLIGVGIADCTGPASEVTFMGYAKTSQKGCGIHLRQYSRAFIFDDGDKRAIFVSVDTGMISNSIRKAVLIDLHKLYNNIYNVNNLVISGTHTHGAPGGFLMEFMYDLPSLGFVKGTFDALVEGIVKSISNAHHHMVKGQIFVSSGEIFGANINRSPLAYMLNPQEERSKYKYDVDKEMVQLKFVKSSDRSLIGAINWFPVHPTSMNFTNCLVTSDNVGYASILLEKSVNKHTLIGKGTFVSTFASTNLGDVSPNTKGATCITTGERCNLQHSTCDGKADYCVASGPGEDMFTSTKMIAEKLFDKAKMLLNSEDSTEVTGSINYIHQFVDMPSETAIIENNGSKIEVTGCLPAMGYSFAAGTTDGVGEFDFSQGMKSSRSQWDNIRDVLFPPTPEDIKCHSPKPILINSGRISNPYEWQPRIVSTQLLQIGTIVMIAVPGEFTTMSGRRLRNLVSDIYRKNGSPQETRTVITGLSNVYSSYIATPEEYQMQRYEGASTVYGPHTLTLYLNIYKRLAEASIHNQTLAPGPSPADLTSKLLSLLPGVLFDTPGLVQHFGDCLQHPPPTVIKGETVTARFVSGHPRNDVMHGKTFLTIEKLTNDDGKWVVVATDSDWETKFIWKRTSQLIGGSEATIEWTVPDWTSPGIYRIQHFGKYKSFWGGIYDYSGVCHNFTVL